MKRGVSKFTACLFLGGLLLASCTIEVSAGSIEERDKPKVDGNLAPLSNPARDYAETITARIYDGGVDSLSAGIDARVTGSLDGKTLERIIGLASKSGAIETMEYYGHAFGQEDGIDFTLMQIRVLRDGGYDLVKIVMDEDGAADGACCTLVGLHLEKTLIKRLGARGEDND